MSGFMKSETFIFKDLNKEFVNPYRKGTTGKFLDGKEVISDDIKLNKLSILFK